MSNNNRMADELLDEAIHHFRSMKVEARAVPTVFSHAELQDSKGADSVKATAHHCRPRHAGWSVTVPIPLVRSTEAILVSSLVLIATTVLLIYHQSFFVRQAPVKALVRAGELVTLFQREVPLGDEFVCLVSVKKYSSPGSPRSPYCMSQVRFARRNPERPDAFVLEFIGDATPGWHKMGTCRAWSLMSPEAAIDYLYEQGKTPMAPSELTEAEQLSALIAGLSPNVQVVIPLDGLDEPLRRCVPTALQDSGIMLITGEWGVQYVHEFAGFPLGRLASAIRTAARDGDWSSDDPAALLLENNMGDPALTDDDEQAIAQALVYRLLDYLS